MNKTFIIFSKYRCNDYRNGCKAVGKVYTNGREETNNDHSETCVEKRKQKSIMENIKGHLQGPLGDVGPTGKTVNRILNR